jgi:uncharacterized protein (DUF362 family)/Pyruvate/2-oxoacid:ferredoxin oxidoreductase delta subunit
MTDKTSPAVSIIRCADYDRDRVFSAIKQAVDLLGGMRAFVKPGERVLIKPNLLKASPPEAAVTTHPEVVRAVIRLVREAGGVAMVGDSPGIGDLRKVSAKAGILDVIEEEGATLVELDDPIEIKSQGRFHRFEISRTAYEADAIINLPKLKTHGMTTLTGAVKNLFGCVPGKRKVQWHFNAGVNHELFAIMLNELCALLKPRLTIMDAVIGMEGNGPGSGDPRRIGVVIVGQDPVAVDVVSSLVLGVKPEHLPLITAAAASGLGETRPERISVLGESLSNVKIRHFKLPPRAHFEWKLPEWTRRSLKNAFTSKPVIDNRLCIQCGICQDHCPQKAIESRGAGLEVRYRDCIRCFCCQEFCPEGAITVGRGWALKMVKKY